MEEELLLIFGSYPTQIRRPHGAAPTLRPPTHVPPYVHHPAHGFCCHFWRHFFIVLSGDAIWPRQLLKNGFRPVCRPLCMNAKRYPSHLLPAVRLARLAVSNKARGRRYGELLLSEALHRTVCIADQAGVIGLFADAKDENARLFYLRLGFLPLPEYPLQLFLPIKTICLSI